MSVSKQRIKLLRKERGWTQEQLSIISGLSERTIQRIEGSGDCSLDSKMALASAFEVSPNELEDKLKSHLIFEEPNEEPNIDWASALGYISIIIILPIVLFVLTSTNGIWEISCLLIIDGLTIALSSSSHGFEETIRFFANTLLTAKNTAKITSYNATILHARLVCQNVYIIGFVTMAVYLLIILIHVPDKLKNINIVLVEASIPILYAVLVAEFWIRPFKHKIEKQLAGILGTIEKAED